MTVEPSVGTVVVGATPFVAIIAGAARLKVVLPAGPVRIVGAVLPLMLQTSQTGVSSMGVQVAARGRVRVALAVGSVVSFAVWAMTTRSVCRARANHETEIDEPAAVYQTLTFETVRPAGTVRPPTRY